MTAQFKRKSGSKYFDVNENENSVYQILWNAAKATFWALILNTYYKRGKFPNQFS